VVPQARAEERELAVAGRRELLADLARAVAPGSALQLLAVIRLHGLSALRDRAGTDARDGLVEEARQRALVDVGRAGTVYVSRKDEVCILLDGSFMESISKLANLTWSLNELGRPHNVAAETGVALLPEEADDPIGALRRADSRTVPGEYTKHDWDSADRRARRSATDPPGA